MNPGPPPKSQRSSKHAMALGISGGLAGGLAKTAVAPLERVKLLMQCGNARGGLLLTMHTVVHREGWWSLWRGNTINVVRMVPSKCVLLSCSDIYKDVVRDLQLCSSTFAVGGLAGAFAGASATFCTYPLDLIRTRMAGVIHGSGGSVVQGTVLVRPPDGAVATFLDILRREGVLALFRGAGPTVIGALPYEGIKFGTYDLLKRHVHFGSESVAAGGPLWPALWGSTAAIIAHIATFPNDVRLPERDR